MFSYYVYLTLTLFLTDKIDKLACFGISKNAYSIKFKLTCEPNTSHSKDFILQSEGTDIRNVSIMCSGNTTISNLTFGSVYAIVRKYNHQICTLTSF